MALFEVTPDTLSMARSTTTGHVDAAGALSDHLDHPFVPTYWSLGKQPRLISATAVVLMANNLASSRRPSHLGDCGYYYGK
mmetsp:Transcript_16219/g.24225  ORF Transcript_16219/g.24225 Transcript_16219/m.24225 type:complete len:81 (-) Transcript_16219:61-303(-)